MSVNISLGDTPGVSAYFDGQPIQDELEAEIRREEERQEKELRNLLATELEDFEEDFLSDSNSDEDSVNVSRVSRASSHRFNARQNEQSKALQQASNKLVQLAPDSTPKELHGNKTGHNNTEADSDVYFSPLSQRNHPVFPNPQVLLHKQKQQQQNVLQQQSQLQQQQQQQLQNHGPINYPYQQEEDASQNQNHQRHFIPTSQYDNALHGHDNVRSVEGNNSVFPPSYNNDNDADDDWMMKVQQSHAVTAVSSASSQFQQHSPHHHHHHYPQQQLYTPLSQPINADMLDTQNLPLPIPNHLRNVQQQQQPFHSTAIQSPSSQPSTPKNVQLSESPVLPASPTVMTLEHSRQKALPETTDDYDNYQVQYKTKPKKTSDVNENDFYIQNENVEFFRAEGGEEKRSYQQLEVLYRARGRELEDLNWKLKQAEEDAAKEARMYKHKLALANGDLEGGQDSLRQCQSLMQQAKADLTASQALNRTLETQVTTFKEAKEELIKKLQVAESTIENLSHQCEELQQSESLSRARNEHDNVVASLTQRFERELLSVKEKLDETKNQLETKHDECVWLKKQLADSTKELEQAQISRGETINRLAKSLEDSQRQCQALLEQSSSQEIASLKVKLQQSVASKTVSEEMCDGLQLEIKELKEQLTMFESASALGAVSTASMGGASHSQAHKKGAVGAGLDDSMTDLGIKKTLDFDTPSSTPKLADTSSLEELVSSLRSELEKCLFSNRRKRTEIAEKAGEIQTLKHELDLTQTKSQDLEKMCAEQKMRLKEFESIMSSGKGESLVEVRLRRDLDALAKEKAILLEDIEDYKKRLEEIGASEARLTEINTELSAQIAHMVSDFDSDKATALDRCQRTLEEVHQMTLNNVRTELESRLASEKSMLVECHKMELDRVKEQLTSAQDEAHSVKNLYIQTCDQMKKQEEETRSLIRKEVEEELALVSKSKKEIVQTALVKEEQEKRLCVEDNFAKEKESWKEKRELLEKEIEASKDIIAEVKSSHEKDVGELQETITDLKCQHKDEMNALDDRLAELMSNHQVEVKKLLEDSGKIQDVEKEYGSKLELLKKQYKDEKDELERLLQEERKLKSVDISTMNRVHNDVSVLTSSIDLKDISVQTEDFKCGGGVRDYADNDTEKDNLRKRLAQLEAEIQSIEEEHLSALEKLKIEHKREFEKAARNREEKFQVELRYFLKDKDDRFKEKLEAELKKFGESRKVEYEKCVKDKESEIEELKKELVSAQFNVSDEDSRNESNKMLEDVVTKLNAEKSEMEGKIQRLVQDKKEELSRLMEKHANEEKALIEKYNNKIETITTKHKEECAQLHWRVTELENSQRTSPEFDDDNDKDDRTTDDQVKMVLSARVREERAKWFKDAQDYIQNEIESGIAQRQQQCADEIASGDSWTMKLNEEVNRNVELEISKIKARNDLEIQEEVEQRVREKLSEEVKRLKIDREEKEMDNKKTVDLQVKQKLATEVENLQIKFLSELEARVSKEKVQLEQDVKKWKEDMKKKIDGDKEAFVAQINREMGAKFAAERKRVEVEIMQGKQEELKEMRKEMEEEMRKRIEKEKKEWKKEEEDWKRMNEGGGMEDTVATTAIRDKLRAAEDACNKAFREREQTVELMKRREASYKEDKHKLVAGLKQLRQDLNATKEEQAALEEKYALMDRKYKEDMKEAKRKKELALEELQAKAEEEKEKLMVDYRHGIASMKEDFTSELDRVKSEAEMERAAVLMEVRSHTERALTLSPMQEPDTETTTLFELRDHYLETVNKIKDDVMTHVQAANSRAANTMKTEMRKQRRRLIHVFKERCKASIRSILTGQVPSNVLNSLDHAVDLIAEAMVLTPKSATSTSTTSPSNKMLQDGTNSKSADQTKTPGGRYHAVAARPERGDNRGERNSNLDKNNVVRESEKSRHLDHLSRDGEQAPPPPPLKTHPQLAKVDFYDSHTGESCSPQSSAQSSPAAITPRSMSVLGNTNTAISSPPIPRLDLSPFHAPEQTDNSTTHVSKGQRYQHTHEYFDKAKHRRDRPRSAEASVKATQSQNAPGDFRHNVSKSKQNFGETRPVKNTDESSSPSPSPRDRMKMIEAQVRLANWAASGEMPWKGPGSKGRAQRHDGDDVGREDIDDNTFVRPGKEAEMFLKAQKSMKKNDGEMLFTPMKKDKEDVRLRRDVSKEDKRRNYQKVPMEQDGYITDSSSVSTESHSSFVTLEPDAEQQRSQLAIQEPKGKDWKKYTSDYDRIKESVFEKSNSPFANVTLRRKETTKVGGLNFSSDDDVKSIDSDDVPHYKQLPTSTPSKRRDGDEKRRDYSKPYSGFKSVPEKHKSKVSSSEDWIDNEGNREHNCQEWKTVNAYSSYPGDGELVPAAKNHHRDRLEKPSYSQPRPAKSQLSLQQNPPREIAKSTDFEFADISEITQASEDVAGGVVGRGMWRYKSLEDLLPNQAKGRSNDDVGRGGGGGGGGGSRDRQGRERNEREDVNRNHPDRVTANTNNSTMSKRAPPPIQAMDSDFWKEQSLEDDHNEEGKTVDRQRLEQFDQWENEKHARRNHNSHQIHKHKYPSSAPRNLNRPDNDKEYYDSSVYSRRAHHSAEPTWNKKQYSQNSKSNPLHLQYSSSPSYNSSHHIQRRSKPSPPPNTIPHSKPQDQPMSSTHYSTQFDAHVDDLRKSLESMEMNPFSSTKHKDKGSKSKMKRSVSEQSLHTIEWDKDRSADIDDLVNAYTIGSAGGQAQSSYFDLHNFGNEEAF